MAATGATQTGELDQAWVEDFINRWEAAWNSHEPARVLGLITDQRQLAITVAYVERPEDPEFHRSSPSRRR